MEEPKFSIGQRCYFVNYKIPGFPAEREKEVERYLGEKCRILKILPRESWKAGIPVYLVKPLRYATKFEASEAELELVHRGN